MPPILRRIGRPFIATVCDDGAILVLTNELFHVPLYAWYVIEIEVFNSGDVQGTLMTPPFEFHGPLDTEQEGRTLVQGLYKAHITLDDQVKPK